MKIAAVALGLPAAALGVLLLLVVLILGGNNASAVACASPASSVEIGNVPAGPVAGYNHDQLVNAAHIMNAASTVGLDSKAQAIGVMTAMGESSLTILDHGDTVGLDSRGLFQQRGNGAWGSYEDRMNPDTSSVNFFTALKAVTGWADMQPTIAAHKVQRNADPYHYEKFWTPAVAVVNALAGITAVDSGAGSSCSGDVVLPLTRPFKMTDNFGPRPFTGAAGSSTLHPADDLVGTCGVPVFASVAGTVTLSDRLTLSVKSPAGYTVSYLHMHKGDRMVDVGDEITPGEQIGKVGNEAPATGCHLDIRINTAGNTDAAVAALPQRGDLPGWVNPEDFFQAFGITLCDDTCVRQYRD